MLEINKFKFKLKDCSSVVFIISRRKVLAISTPVNHNIVWLMMWICYIQYTMRVGPNKHIYSYSIRVHKETFFRIFQKFEITGKYGRNVSSAMHAWWCMYHSGMFRSSPHNSVLSVSKNKSNYFTKSLLINYCFLVVDA